MNREQFENQWTQIRPILKEKWNSLTDEDIRQINGRYEQLITKLQQRYGYNRDMAEEELRNWSLERGTRTYGHEKAYSSSREDEAWKTKRTDNKSALKWALAAGLPLLLLAGYLAYEGGKTQEEAYMRSRAIPQTIVAENPADRNISQNIRQGLYDNGMAASELENIRIEIQNGIVTIRGTVSSDDQSNAIQQTIEGVSGVRRVNNQLQVR